MMSLVKNIKSNVNGKIERRKSNKEYWRLQKMNAYDRAVEELLSEGRHMKDLTYLEIRERMGKFL